MNFDISQTAMAITAILAPFAPYLVEVGKIGGEELVEMMARYGGETAWNKAKALWGKLKSRFKDDQELQSAVTMVAAKPEDEARQSMLAEVLIARLQENTELAGELFDLLGGQEAVQQVLADRSSWVEDVTQQMKGKGMQSVRANENSVIKGVKQTME